jgi:hypothetical protein
MSWFGKLKSAVSAIPETTSIANIRNFSGRVEREKIVEDNYHDLVKGDPFEPEKTYFSIRLAEMWLSEAGRYGLQLLPMCCCFLKYSYAGSQRNIPYVLGHETIASGLGGGVSDNTSRRITFSDMYIVRNVPMKADNLTMYIAFCRAKSSGFARGLLSLFSDTAKVLAGPIVGGALQTGVDLTTRLAGLLGADDVETRFGVMSGNALTKSGYYVHAGTPASELTSSELEMRNGQLYRVDDSGKITTLDRVDYLVVAIECRPTIISADFGQVTTLPFHMQWIATREKILAGDVSTSAQEMKKLLIAVAASPDVTEADRVGLITAYRKAFDEWSAVKSDVGTVGGGATMGGGFGPRIQLLELANRSKGTTSQIAALASEVLGKSATKDDGRLLLEMREGLSNVEGADIRRNNADAAILGKHAGMMIQAMNQRRLEGKQVASASTALMEVMLSLTARGSDK